MCRWIAYAGPPLSLGALLTRPDHSLVDQSVRATESAATTNADGFGVGWYAENAGSPGRYRGTHPAWNDANLRDLAAHVSSRLFLAHVRASSGAPVQVTNCHPFRFRRWLFQHNGSVPGFGRIARDLLMSVDPELFPCIEGNTDSEALFFLALTYGLDADPQGALQRTIGRVEEAMRQKGIGEELTFSVATSDGRRLVAVRYASRGGSPTLYHSADLHALRAVDGSYEALPDGAVVLVSEPLDDLRQHWVAVPDGSFVGVEGGDVRIATFGPES